MKRRSIHFRRCHVCGTVNSCEAEPVINCSDCGKSLAPFYYFDERFIIVASDLNIRSPLLDNEYSPIQGLTVYWESF